MHDIVKVVMDASYPYNDFLGWWQSMDTYDKEVWTYISKDSGRTEQNSMLLTKKAMELYCLEMGIDYIPNSEEYLDKMFRRLISMIVIASLIDRGMVYIGSGRLSFIEDATPMLTEKGKNYQKESKADK